MAPTDKTKSKAKSETPDTPPPAATEPAPAVAETPVDTENLDTVFSALNTLMTTVDKLQKSRQDVGDIKPLIVRMLDGELLSGEELETLKTGVSGLSKLVRIYSDYQTALEKAQPAREILDTVLK